MAYTGNKAGGGGFAIKSRQYIQGTASGAITINTVVEANTVVRVNEASYNAGQGSKTTFTAEVISDTQISVAYRTAGSVWSLEVIEFEKLKSKQEFNVTMLGEDGTKDTVITEVDELKTMIFSSVRATEDPDFASLTSHLSNWVRLTTPTNVNVSKTPTSSALSNCILHVQVIEFE